MTKRANGEGSIYSRKNKHGKTQYVVSVSMGYDPRGKRRRTTRMVNTKREALALRTKLIADLQKGQLSVISNETVRTYGTKWINDHKSLHVRPSTASDYLARLERDVCPHLGSVRLVDLRPQQVETWMRKLKDAGKRTSTINGARRVLFQMCKHASRIGVIASNPVLATDPIRRQKSERTQVQAPWSLSETHQALEAARLGEDRNIDIFLHLMLHTGLRPGEALGLRWSDVDMQNKTFNVTGTLREVRSLLPDGTGRVQLIRNDPKTAASNRVLPIADALYAALIRHQMYLDVVQNTTPPEWTNSGYVLITRAGTPFSLSNFRRRYKGFLLASGIRYIRLHDLRHTVATLSLDTGGVPIEQTSQALGHTRIDTTKQIYAPHIPRYNEEFIKGLSQTLPPAPQADPSPKSQHQEARHT
jgi:integrase